jgi:Integrase core domain
VVRKFSGYVHVGADPTRRSSHQALRVAGVSPVDAVFAADAVRIIRTPVRAPRANAICERVIGTILNECVDRMLIPDRRHLEAVLAEYVEHENAHRPHHSLDQRAPSRLDSPLAAIVKIDPAKLRRSDRLGGLIHEYRIAACADGRDSRYPQNTTPDVRQRLFRQPIQSFVVTRIDPPLRGVDRGRLPPDFM